MMGDLVYECKGSTVSMRLKENGYAEHTAMIVGMIGESTSPALSPGTPSSGPTDQAAGRYGDSSTPPAGRRGSIPASVTGTRSPTEAGPIWEICATPTRRGSTRTSTGWP
jgi:hypothetical protein